MQKYLPILLICTLLAGCNAFPANKPTLTSEEMATRVALLLTAMPTTTGEPVINTESPVLPTVAEPTVLKNDEIGAIATPTTEITLSTPTPDETALAQFLGAEVTPTPLIAMPSETPTATVPVTPTTEGTSVTGTQSTGMQMTATFTATDPRTLLGNPTWTDSMDKGSNWPTGSDSYTTIDFQNGFMVLGGLTKDNGWRLAINDVDNAYFETTAKFGSVCKGMDRWGMMFRVPDRATADKGYWFNITCDGKFALQKWNASPPSGEKSVTNLIAWTANSKIQTGANAVNRIGILAKAGQFKLYINGQQVGEATDNSFLKGGYGVLVGAKETDKFTIYVDELSYWLNPNL
jgi:hypothetical protein